MATKPFAPAADLAARDVTLEVLAEGGCVSGTERPITWTAECDQEIRAQLQP